jgi:mannosylglycerate hydrolase
MSPEPTSRPVVVVPHTHWDREWYEPYQTFRLRLVDLLDDLLPRLDADPSYAHFLLDGQMAVVDDYLAVRPEAESVLRRLAVSGRLAMGPWYILMDEFLVSGETMIRDLQLGLTRAAAFGGAMEVGYLPDMFGHVAQMPQLLRQFGFEHAVVWRGVPESMTTTAFWWESPDGSVVRAQYLPDGYSNGASLPDDAKDLVTQIRAFEHTYGSLAGDARDGPLLWMNGTDHQMPRPWLGRVVAEANAVCDDYAIRVGSLASYLSEATTIDLDHVGGELRSGARANLLMGVGSNRVDVHQASAAGERALERLAEPLSALWLAPGRWPGALLDEAWLDMIRNSAHDSVCACSVDEVSDAVLHRYAEARQIGEGLTDRALAAVGRTVGGDQPAAVNPSARTRSGLVELALSGDPQPGEQVLARYPADRVLDGLTRSQLAGALLGIVYNDNDVVDGHVEVGADGVLELRLGRDPVHATGTWSGAARGEVAELAAADPEAPGRLVLSRPAGRRILVRATDVPGFGFRRMGPPGHDTTEDATGDVTGARPVEPVTVDGLVLVNGLVTVALDPERGTFSVDGQPGFGLLVDDGDAGDTYNWCPPDTDQVVDRPDQVTIDIRESGPLRARAVITTTWTWPERLVDGARTGARSVDIATTVEVQAGQALIRLTTQLINPCRDHRVRVHFPLPQPARESRAECAFTVVRRGLTAEGGPNEWGVPTFPSRRFVQAGGLTLVHDGLLEYELVDVDPSGDQPRAGALALTLLRCTGIISRGPMTSRPWPAGPPTPVEGPQMLGPHTLRYAIQVGPADPYALVDDAFLPLLVADPAKIRGMAGVTAAPGHEGRSGQALSVAGAEVSSVRRVGGRLEVRVWNPGAEPTTVELAGRSGWLVDLRGAPVEPFEGRVELAPWRIATLVIDE